MMTQGLPMTEDAPLVLKTHNSVLNQPAPARSLAFRPYIRNPPPADDSGSVFCDTHKDCQAIARSFWIV
jgi:hypothetical protein